MDRGSFDHVVRQMVHSCFAAWSVKYERSRRSAVRSVRRVGVVLVWVGGGDFISARMAHLWHFFGVGHTVLYIIVLCL